MQLKSLKQETILTAHRQASVGAPPHVKSPQEVFRMNQEQNSDSSSSFSIFHRVVLKVWSQTSNISITWELGEMHVLGPTS